MSAIKKLKKKKTETKALERPRNRKKDNVEQIIAAMKESQRHFDLAVMLGRADPSPAGGNRSILRPGWGSRGQAAKPEGSCWERSWERSWEGVPGGT